MRELARGLWHWTARHPEWHPRGFGDAVSCYAVRADGVTLAIDPLLPAGDGESEALASRLDDVAEGEVAILITMPYHVRSAESLLRRWGDRVSLWGHPSCARRLSEPGALREIQPGAELPGGARAFAIGKPRRFEMPLWLPSHRAIAFGDAVVSVGGELRVWLQREIDERRRRWYRERLAPTLTPLTELDVERVLVTHGEPVLSGGREALRAAVAGEPWYHAPS